MGKIDYNIKQIYKHILAFNCRVSVEKTNIYNYKIILYDEILICIGSINLGVNDDNK